MTETSAPLTRAEAARLNGAKSRGPISAEGKARSSRNACKHGMYARDEFLVSCDDGEAFDAFRLQLHHHYVPDDPVQTTLVERIVIAAWRLRRILGAERCEVSCNTEPKRYDPTPARRRTFFGASRSHLDLTRYEAAVERSMYHAIHELQALQAKNQETNP